MKENFLNYSQSLAVKELGFDIETIHVYKTNTILIGKPIELDYFDYDYRTTTNAYIKSNHMIGWCVAPLKSQFFKWVRDKHGIYHLIEKHFDNTNDKDHKDYSTIVRNEKNKIACFRIYDTYEQAEDALINKIIELIKQKQ